MSIPENLLFISGPHGVGKTTFKRLFEKQSDRFLSFVKSEHFAKLTDPYERQLLRICKYRIDYDRQVNLAIQNPDKIIVCDRCVFDGVIYTKALYNYGMINLEQFNKINSQYSSLFQIEDLPQNIIFLDNSFDEISNRLQERQKVEGAKWNENDLGYLNEVIATYRKYYLEKLTVPNLIHITDTDNFDKVNKSIELINEINF